MHLPRPVVSGIIGPAPKWWNWQTRCVQGAVPYGCAGSNPAFGTKDFHPAAHTRGGVISFARANLWCETPGTFALRPDSTPLGNDKPADPARSLG